MKKIRNKRIYKGGGELPGNEIKVISSGTAYSTNNQLPGNTGSTGVEDPYAFAVKMGVTTLNPTQWKKLDAAQQQTIWRQGFEKAGFTQIGENSFSSNGQINKFAYGGEIGSSIGSALGTALKFIPGIGPIASTLATPLLSSLGGAAGSALDNKASTQIPVAKEVAKTINPTGSYKQGGTLTGGGGNIRRAATPSLQVNREATQPDAFKYGVIPAIDNAMNRKLNGYLFSTGVDTDDSINVTVRGGGLDYKTPISEDSKLSIRANLGINKANVFVPGVDKAVYSKFQAVPQIGLSYKFRDGGNLPQYAAGGAPTGDGYVKPEEVYSYLISKGLSKEHALGMLANIQHESSFNPASYTIDSNDLPSGGLFQHNGSRYEAMVKHAGNDWKTNWQDQIDYALSEADTKKYLANKFSSPEEASMWFTKNWERPANADAKAKERVAALSEFDFAHQDEFDFAHQGNPRDMFIKAVTTPTVGAGMVGAAGTGIAMNKDAMNSMIIQRPNLINYQQKINSTGMGIRKYGGQVASNVVATSGGKFEDLGSNIILAKGKLHSEGGIKLDTNNQGGFDGMADIEVEDGEPIITDAGDTGYVINRDVAKPYVKLLKQLADRQDKVSDNTRNLMKQEMIKKNEVLKESKGIEYKNGGALPSYYQGGLALSGLSDAVRNYNGAPYAGSFYNPFGGDNSVGATFGMVDPQTTSTINSTPTTPNTASLKSSSSGISASGDTGSVFSMDNSSDNLKTPTGDALQLAGMAIPTLYNLGRGLFDKAETVNPSYNPYEGEALSTLKSRSYNPQAIQNQLDRTFAAGRADINNLTSSAGTRLGNIQNLYSNLGQQRAAVDLQGQQMNNQYKADTASALDNFGRQRLAAEGAANEYNWSNQVAKDNYISEGISNLGQTLTAFGQQKNTAAMNAVGLKILNEAFPNYYFDANTINQITSGVKPSWMKDDEFEKAKVLIYRAGFKG